MKNTIKVTLSIPAESRFEAVIKAAEAVGFERESAFATLGVATGTVPSGRLAQLRGLDGIGSVEPERTYRPR